MPQLLTVLEGYVAPDRVPDLRGAYAEAALGPFPPGLIRSLLLQDRREPTRWRMESLWTSPEALAALRDIPGEPRGVKIFEAAGVTPELRVFEVADSFSAQTSTA